MSLAKLLLKRWREEHGFPEPPPSPAVGVKAEASAQATAAARAPLNPLLALARTLSSNASEPDRCVPRARRDARRARLSRRRAVDLGAASALRRGAHLAAARGRGTLRSPGERGGPCFRTVGVAA
jgi:hypothetical protein